MPRMSSSRRAPRARYSQNFLTDPSVAAAMVRLSHVTRQDLVVEVGPGRGMLTRVLARKAGRVLAYEIDPALSTRLSHHYAADPRVRCVHRDFLSTSPPRERFQLIANIPYNRTNAITRWCLDAPQLSGATLLTQLEYARKRTGDYGRWSKVTIKSWPVFEWRLLGRVARHKFDPVPAVDSGIMRIARRPDPLLPASAMRDYESFVELGFSGVGGSFAASMRHGHGARNTRTALRGLGIFPTTAVGEVTPQQWITAFRRLRP